MEVLIFYQVMRHKDKVKKDFQLIVLYFLIFFVETAFQLFNLYKTVNIYIYIM